MAAGSDGTVLFAVVFDGRFSPVGVTAAAHSASDRGIPAGAAPFPEDGTSTSRLGSGAVPGGAGLGDGVGPGPGPPVATRFLITAVAREVADVAPKALVARTITRMR